MIPELLAIATLAAAGFSGAQQRQQTLVLLGRFEQLFREMSLGQYVDFVDGLEGETYQRAAQAFEREWTDGNFEVETHANAVALAESHLQQLRGKIIPIRYWNNVTQAERASGKHRGEPEGSPHRYVRARLLDLRRIEGKWKPYQPDWGIKILGPQPKGMDPQNPIVDSYIDGPPYWIMKS